MVLLLMAACAGDHDCISCPPSGTDQLERAGHTAVVWDQWMWVYGGYQFPRDSSNMSLDGSAVDESVTAAQLIRCV